MTRPLFCVITMVAIAWLPGCHSAARLASNNKNGNEQPRVDPSRYPYVPPTTSDRKITLRITHDSQTAEVTQLEGHIVRIERGSRPIWKRPDADVWTIGLVCSITGERTATVALLSINGSMDTPQPLFSESAQPVASYDLAMGTPQAIGGRPTLDLELIAIAPPSESMGAKVRACCVDCGGLGVCALSVQLDCGSCTLLDQGHDEQSK